jgi:hypothetical protein
MAMKPRRVAIDGAGPASVVANDRGAIEKKVA